MTSIQYFWRHPLAEQVRAEGREQGRLQGRREIIPKILEWRGVPPDSVHERVTACTDLDQLAAWARCALNATDAGELFADE
ncbi:hypothetical protein [Streptomyces sp. SLBN-31]|uniref:hypothetical protein n=1 Tax=Streptomyces sp. SLBN-31 TaxID=2768444 RepID=UPI001154314C|nr:hypothetical protein [Streptomyces sp. SLBN-31]TQJ88313.1 hypothetical protein FBY22_7185 [Streptomyces sp. SLBN-31]